MTDDRGDSEQLRVSKIRDGTVIDHVAAGQALNVLSLLGIDGADGLGVS
ncbi:MAG: aspartate carbamoyltransferase, regulatory subunit, partial [halophilic archaeon J07HB67]